MCLQKVYGWLKSHIKARKMRLPLHEFSFVKATAPFFHVIGDVGEAVE